MRKKKFETVTYRDIFTGEMMTRQERVREVHKKGAGPWNGKLLTRQMLIDAGVEDVDENGKFIIVNGRRVRSHKCAAGYRSFRISGIGDTVYAHRVVFAWNCGECKAGLVIDHKNAIRDDNRLENLQERTQAENVRMRGDHSKSRLEPDENGEHLVDMGW